LVLVIAFIPLNYFIYAKISISFISSFSQK
jgi:hypothetical protein